MSVISVDLEYARNIPLRTVNSPDCGQNNCLRMTATDLLSNKPRFTCPILELRRKCLNDSTITNQRIIEMAEDYLTDTPCLEFLALFPETRTQ